MFKCWQARVELLKGFSGCTKYSEPFTFSFMPKQLEWVKFFMSIYLPERLKLAQNGSGCSMRPPLFPVHHGDPVLIHTLLSTLTPEIIHKTKNKNSPCNCGKNCNVAKVTIKMPTRWLWGSFNALLEESIDIKLWAGTDLLYFRGLRQQKTVVTVIEEWIKWTETEILTGPLDNPLHRQLLSWSWSCQYLLWLGQSYWTHWMLNGWTELSSSFSWMTN